MYQINKQSIAALLLMTATGAASANLLRNASFEDVPSGATGQALMPSEWVTANVTPDTYSNDGSYGITPGGFGNFPGVTAYDGKRWVAAWSRAGQERFGQALSESLVSGSDYLMSGYLHQAVRSDLNNPGGYEVYLTDLSTDAPVAGEYLGYLGTTGGVDEGWLEYDFSFTATDAMASLSFLMFAPVSDTSAYPGLDSVSLTGKTGMPVPEPALALLIATGLFGMVGFSRRKA